MPAVIRSVDILTSVSATFTPTGYRDGFVASDQPLFLQRPDPNLTRVEFLSQSVHDLVVNGECFWLLSGVEGNAEWATVLPWAEVEVEPDESGLRASYAWRDQKLVLGETIAHIALGRRAGEMRGISPLKQALPTLENIYSAEAFASMWFSSGGVPSTILTTGQTLTADEASLLQAQWVAARSSAGAGSPAVLSQGMTADFPSTNPEQSQMLQSRDQGVATVARLLGIPGALLMANTAGSTIYYSNVESAISSLVKATVLPMYLTPIEQALSDLVSDEYAVRFGMNELERTEASTRFAIYKIAIDAGILSADDVRIAEGIGSPVTTTNFQPIPDREEV